MEGGTKAGPGTLRDQHRAGTRESILALCLYALGLFLYFAGTKGKGHDAAIALIGGVLFGTGSIVLGTVFGVIAVARKEKPGVLPAVAIALPLGIIAVILLMQLV